MSEPKPGKKRDRTRDRLLVAAQELMLERPASSLTIRDVTSRAEVVHATFYNYFDSIESLIEGVGLVFTLMHGQTLLHLTRNAADPADVVSLSTRQTLRMLTLVPAFGHYLFDAGLPIDKFASGMRFTLRRDIETGLSSGRFHVDDVELTVSMIAGSLVGVALDLHRKMLTESAIEAVTARILIMLGLSAGEASAIAHADVSFITPPSPPLTLFALELQRQELAA